MEGGGGVRQGMAAAGPQPGSCIFFDTTATGLIKRYYMRIHRIHPETAQLSLFYRNHPKEKRNNTRVPGKLCISISAAVLDLAVAEDDEDEQDGR